MLLVDHFMDKHIVMDYRLKLVALTCLLVAGELLFNLFKLMHGYISHCKTSLFAC